MEKRKKYIRFGEVPKSEKSVNFINLSFDLVLEVLIKNFENASFDASKEVGSCQVHEFGGRQRINKRTGERVSEYEEVANPAEWVLSPLKVRYCWMGWTFSNPVKDFAD